MPRGIVIKDRFKRKNCGFLGAHSLTISSIILGWESYLTLWISYGKDSTFHHSGNDVDFKIISKGSINSSYYYHSHQSWLARLLTWEYRGKSSTCEKILENLIPSCWKRKIELLHANSRGSINENNYITVLQKTKNSRVCLFFLTQIFKKILKNRWNVP